MSNPNGIKYVCDFCGQLIEIGRPRFILKGELFGAYDGAEFDETLLPPSANIQEEMKRLIAEAEKKSEKELTDEVHYAFKADLCRACRDKFYRILDEGRFG
ncbi:MAG: hypothetical protein AB1656_01015 [Candidatus Omnitrophota bacterium]